MMHPGASEWVYDEGGLRLAKALFDTEIRLGREALTTAPLAKLPPVLVRARIGALSTEFEIVRRHVRHEFGPRQERIDHIWCCIDYNRMRFRDGRTGSEIAAAELTSVLWFAVDRAFTEGLEAFMYLAPQGGIRTLFHFIGRHSGGAWYPRQFQSLGGAWYPETLQLLKLRERETTVDAPVLGGNSWRFELLPAPRLVNAEGESLTHEGANDPDFDPDAIPHHFLYEGRHGRYRIPASFLFLTRYKPMPRVWRVDYRTPFEIRPGFARGHNHPANPGAARLSEGKWTQLEQTLTGAFLHWPRTSAAGYRPLWIEFDRGYREGAWGTRLREVGSNNAVTGLPDFSE